MDINEEPIAREPVATARANLSEITAQVRIRRTVIILTRRDKPQAALVPAELGEAVHAAGGPDAVTQLLLSRLEASS
jgi:prevent-host-death family protein